jgi:hypothetical protein
LSLPSAKSTPTGIGDVANREGRLANTSVPELLARAYRVEFSGTLMLEPADSAPSSVRFVAGTVVEASGPFKTSEHEWEVLGQLLPPDTLEFAVRHAGEYGLEPFAAVERLMLLPSESLVSARQALTVRGVQAMCGLTGDVRYAFVAPAGSPSETGMTLEPLALLMACFLVDPHRERAARSIATFEHAKLTAPADRARRVLATLHGPLRTVLEAIMLSPINMHSLRERHILPSDELVAAVCALWITRVAQVPPPSSGSMRAPAQAAPASARSGTLPPFSPPTTSMLPPRRDSGFQRAVEDPSTAAAKETAMERKVEEAWMTAEADPSRAQQISTIVVKAIGVFPRNPRLRYFLARLHIQAHRLEEAMKELQCALELDPGDQSVAAELEKLRDVVQASPHR